jgi:hypothetical protein
MIRALLLPDTMSLTLYDAQRAFGLNDQPAFFPRRRAQAIFSRERKR